MTLYLINYKVYSLCSFVIFIKKMYSRMYFYMLDKHINKFMTSKHYKKYKETIKEVTKRNYRKRVSSLNQYLENTKCVHCGESEIGCLKFYPHDKDIRKTIKRVDMNDKSRKTVKRLIDSSKIVCSNYLIKIENDLLDPTFYNLL